uniref:Uncharacterized protein n=1 Tax=Glossina morsitans morsitans TaxID=37546 RepID=A0A1B0G2F4_GLOMM
MNPSCDLLLIIADCGAVTKTEIVEPPWDLLRQPRKLKNKFYLPFLSPHPLVLNIHYRIFLAFASLPVKPFDGPWKEQLSKVNKGMEDIKNHIDDAREIDAEISKSIGMNHATSDGLNEKEDDTNDVTATVNT